MAADRHLSELARHMEWADAMVWKAVLVPDESSDTALTELLHHIHLVQHVFSQAWFGEPFHVRERAEFDGARELATWGRGAHTKIGKFLGTADPLALDRELRLPWAELFEQHSQQEAQPHTIGESVLQVVLHTAHHRGQVCTRLRQLGGEPPRIDFIVWLWAGRPAADWTYLEHGDRNADA